MVDEALRSLRTLAITSLLIVVMWMLSWQSMQERIGWYGPTVELQTWLHLVDRLRQMKVDVFEAAATAPIEDDEEEVRRIAPNDETYTVPVPLRVDVTWPGRKSYSISLVPAVLGRQTAAHDSRVYRVVVRNDNPWSDYYALFLRSTVPTMRSGELEDETRVLVGVVPKDCHVLTGDVGSRQVEASIRDCNRPRHWEQLRLPLAKYGYSNEAESLAIRDPALGSLRADLDTLVVGGGVNVLGVQLSLTQFFSGVGILLGAVSLAMMGPVLALRSSPTRKHAQSWILVAPRASGKVRELMESVIMTASLAWAALPIVILFIQIAAYGNMNPKLVWVIWLGAVGIVFSIVTNFVVIYELRRTRLAGDA